MLTKRKAWPFFAILLFALWLLNSSILLFADESEARLIEQSKQLELMTFHLPTQALEEFKKIEELLKLKPNRRLELYLIAIQGSQSWQLEDWQKALADDLVKQDLELRFRLQMQYNKALVKQGIAKDKLLKLNQDLLEYCKKERQGVLCARLLRSMAGFFNRWGERAEAVVTMQAALQSSKNLQGQERFFHYSAQNTLASILYSDKRYDEALRLYEESFQWFRDHEFLHSATNEAYNLSTLLLKFRPDQKQRLRSVLDDAIRLAQKLNDISLTASISLTEGKWFLYLKQYESARRNLEQSLKLFLDIDDKEFAAGTLLALVELCMREQKTQDALAFLNQAEAIITHEYQTERLQIFDWRHKILASQGKYSQAYQQLSLYLQEWKILKEKEEAANLQTLSSTLALQAEQERNKNLVKENELQAQKIKEVQIIRIFSILSFILAMIALLFLWSSIKSKRKAQNHQAKTQMILDHIDEGLFTVSADLRLSDDHSRMSRHLLGTNQSLSGLHLLQDLFSRGKLSQEEISVTHEVLGNSFGEDQIAWELNEGNLPKLIGMGSDAQQLLAIRWIPIFDHKKVLRRVLISLRDISLETQLNLELGSQKKQLAALPEILRETLSTNPKRVFDLLHTLRATLQTLNDPSQWIPSLRTLHTIKGGARALGLKTLSHHLHDLESRIKERGASPGAEPMLQAEIKEIQKLSEDYQAYAEILKQDKESSQQHELFAILAPLVHAWHQQMKQMQFPIASITLIDRVGFFSAEDRVLIETVCLHAVNNSLDHGFLRPRQRGQDVRPPELLITCEQQGPELSLTISDNGQGIAIESLRAKALAQGFPYKTEEDLLEWLFEDGISTAEHIDERSGRGVGLSAIKALVLERHGRIELRNRKDTQGSQVLVHWPYASLSQAA